MKTLFAGFEGLKNSSKLVLDKLENCDKIYLKNDKLKSVEQIVNALAKNKYDQCIILGQKPVIKDKVAIELQAKNNEKIEKTNFEINKLLEIFKDMGIDYYLSQKAGTSYCNNIYFKTLTFVRHNNLKAKVIFLHIPYTKNFASFNIFCKAIKELK